MTGFVQPGPAKTFVLLDEWEKSINDGLFIVEMDGYPDISKTRLVDIPASYHGAAAGFSFADGHSEIKRWRHHTTYNPKLPLNKPTPNSPDVLWMQEHSTRVY
jgi:prepilin-type processing-associated H-X9-DG protein